MNERDFAYWLNGFFELSGTDELTKEQVFLVKEHLKLVFKKETSGIPPHQVVWPGKGYVSSSTRDLHDTHNSGFKVDYSWDTRVQPSC